METMKQRNIDTASENTERKKKKPLDKETNKQSIK
jgi:hypothetical protein